MNSKKSQKALAIAIIASVCAAIFFMRYSASEYLLWQQSNGVGHKKMYVYENIGIALLCLTTICTLLLHKIQSGVYVTKIRYRKYIATLDERQKQSYGMAFAASYNSLVLSFIALAILWDSWYQMQIVWIAILLFYSLPAIFAAIDKKA